MQAQAWPAPWDRYFAMASKTARVAVSYLELGYDLGGQASPERSRLFRSIIGQFSWPKGTTAFWPVAVLGQDGLRPDRALFWRGVAELRVHHVACFGRPGLDIILPGVAPGRTVFFHNRVTVHLLPSPDELLAATEVERPELLGQLRELRF